MSFSPAPRPAAYGAEYVAQVLADSHIDIFDSEEACRLALLDTLGVVPQVEDWNFIRVKAIALRRSQAGGLGL